MNENPYPTSEQCDWCMSRPAVFIVQDSEGREVAVCCRECTTYYQRRFFDHNQGEYNP
jgi:hypothetical protein